MDTSLSPDNCRRWAHEGDGGEITTMKRCVLSVLFPHGALFCAARRGYSSAYGW
jgi:hypothetical protein